MEGEPSALVVVFPTCFDHLICSQHMRPHVLQMPRALSLVYESYRANADFPAVALRLNQGLLIYDRTSAADKAVIPGADWS